MRLYSVEPLKILYFNFVYVNKLMNKCQSLSNNLMVYLSHSKQIPLINVGNKSLKRSRRNKIVSSKLKDFSSLIHSARLTK